MGIFYEVPKKLEQKIINLEKKYKTNGTPSTRTELNKTKVEYFKDIFSKCPEYNDLTFLDCLNIAVTEEMNGELTKIPTEEEIRNCLMSMDPDSVPRPDGFTTKFFQSSWGVVTPEITNALIFFMVITSLNGLLIPILL
ncbi:hypothetical protein P3S67_015689 [Capsicum chacoense]